ncbi:MAG: IclR family transcriptional regulator [Sphingomonadaceae bacterium]
MVGAVAQVMQIFEILVDSSDGATVSDLGARLGINKGSASRLLTTLEAEGYLIQNPVTARYELTLKLLALANRLTDRLGFPAGAQPIIDRLAAEAGELVQLSAADGERLYVIAKAEGDARIAVKSLIGRLMIPHATAAGRAWLSAFPLDEATAIAAKQGLPAYTANTITDLGVLRAELERVAAQGFAVQDEELIPHVSAIAVPIRHRVTGAPLGALDIVAPTFRFPRGRRLGFLDSLKAAAEEIETLWPEGFAQRWRIGRGTGRRE